MSDPELSEDDDELLVFIHVEFCKEISKNELVNLNELQSLHNHGSSELHRTL